MNFEPDIVIARTDNIVVSACQWLCEEDDICTYCLRIENNSEDKIQILSKDLIITDALGNHYVDWEFGFKGEMPELEPGEYFEFESYARLKSMGVLYGTCRVKDARFNKIKDIRVPPLELYANRCGHVNLN